MSTAPTCFSTNLPASAAPVPVNIDPPRRRRRGLNRGGDSPRARRPVARGPRVVTPAMIAANRRNALRSTGPRTPEGKAAVRYNALKHGGRAAVGVLLPGEEGQAFERHLATTAAEIAETADVNPEIIREMACLTWRLDRLAEAEAERAWNREAHPATASDADAKTEDLLGVLAAETKLTGRYLRLMRVVVNGGSSIKRADEQSRGTSRAVSPIRHTPADKQSRGGLPAVAPIRHTPADEQSRGGSSMATAIRHTSADEQSRGVSPAVAPIRHTPADEQSRGGLTLVPSPVEVPMSVRMNRNQLGPAYADPPPVRAPAAFWNDRLAAPFKQGIAARQSTSLPINWRTNKAVAAAWCQPNSVCDL